MTLHALIVHIPIGLLIAYSAIEIGMRFIPLLRRWSWVVGVKMTLLVVGVAAVFIALATGGMAESVVRDINPRAFIIKAHEPFALATALTYFILAGSYCVRFFDQRGWGDRIVDTYRFLALPWNMKKWVAHYVLDTWLAPLLALLGLVLLIVTAGLGVALVYGPDIDPFASFVYHLFWAQ